MATLQELTKIKVLFPRIKFLSRVRNRLVVVRKQVKNVVVLYELHVRFHLYIDFQHGCAAVLDIQSAAYHDVDHVFWAESAAA